MISAFLIQQERRRGRRVLRQRDGAPEVGDDLVSAGLRPSSAETRSRGKTMEVCGRAAVRKSSQICPKSPIYIGGGRGTLPWGPRDSQGVGRAKGGRTPPPNRVGLGLVGGVPLPSHFFPLFFSFSFDFFLLAHRPPWGYPTSPLRAGVSPQSLWASPGWVAPPVNSRNPFVIPGTFPVTPKTFR